MVELILFLKKV